MEATINEGVFRASAGGNLRIVAGETNNTGGTIEALAGSTVTLSGNTDITGGTLRSIGDGSIEFDGTNSATLNDLSVVGNVNLTNDNDVFLSGNIDNQADWSLANGGNFTDIVIENSATLQGGGSITLAGSNANSRILDNSGANGVLTNVDNTIQGQGQIGVNTLQFINQAGGLVDANDTAGSGVLSIDGNSSGVTNQGIFRSSNGATLAIANDFTNNGILDAQSGIIDVNGDLTADIDSLVMGDGVVVADTFANLGVIAPGDGIGNLTIESDLSFFGTSELEIELGALGADLLTVDGDWVLDGTLTLDLLDGFVPDTSDTFIVGTATAGNTLSGVFDNVASGGLLSVGGIGEFTVTYGGGSNNIVLSNFTPTVPEPGSAIILLGLFGVAALRRGNRS